MESIVFSIYSRLLTGSHPKTVITSYSMFQRNEMPVSVGRSPQAKNCSLVRHLPDTWEALGSSPVLQPLWWNLGEPDVVPAQK